MSTELVTITTAVQYATALAQMQSRYNVLTPFASIGGIAPQHAIFTTVVAINLDKSAGQVYDGLNADGRNVLQFLKPGEVALAKNGLRAIAEGLGISVHLEYPSAGQIRNFWHVKAIAAYRGLDGAWVQREASEVWDLRDGSERMRGWTANQIAEGRKHALRQCETRAINAAIRECGCGVKQVYTKAELAKPFVAFRVNFVPDMNDESTRRMVTEKALQGASSLYSQAQTNPSTMGGDAFSDTLNAGDATPVGRGSTPAASGEKPAAPKAAAADAPPTPDSVKIADIKVKTGEKNGRPWTKWTIVDSNGVEASTFSKTDYEDAVRFRDSNTWVEIATERNGEYNNIIEIVKAGTQPDLAGLDGDMRT